MYHPRNNRILASTALALILAIPLGSMAKNDNPPAAASVSATPDAALAATSAEQASTQAARANATEASDPPAISSGASPATSKEQAASTEQAAAPDPLASLDPADRAVAEKIRDLLATKGGQAFSPARRSARRSRRSTRTAISRRSGSTRASRMRAPKRSIARLKNADADGLEPSDYRAPSFAGLAPDALAEAELKLTRAVLTYARHVQAGRFPYTRVSRNIELPQAAPEPADVLSSIADAADAGKALDLFSPQNEPYRKLKAMLAELRGKPGGAKSEARQIETIIANMERWRWYPRDLGKSHVLVNQPDFTLEVMHNGAQVWTTRIVIGKPSMATPLLSETMKYLTVNPTWTVPQSIVRNEYLPALAQDPTVLERMGLRVSYNGGGVHDHPAAGRRQCARTGSVQLSTTASRCSSTTRRTSICSRTRCAPTATAACACRIRPNTPRFSSTSRARASIGRRSKIKRMYGGAEQDIQLQPTPIWVHLTYQTAFVDNAGKLQMRRDIYNLDSRTLAAIKRERGNLEPAPERKREQEIAGSSPAQARPRRRAHRRAPAAYLSVGCFPRRKRVRRRVIR